MGDRSKLFSASRSLCALVMLALASALPAQTVRSPHGAKLTLPCANCHTTTSWSPLRAQPEFNHNRETQFPLRGMHSTVACSSCHVSKNFADAATSCASCHADFHQRKFGAQCENCHTVRGWRVAAQAVGDHRNRFPLLGAHAAAQCDSCHRGAAAGVYVGLSTRCETCHLSQYQSTQVINHRAAGFPTTCETCHNVESWQAARFDHNRFTRFALTGLHSTVACASCHVGGRYQSTSADCFSCHSTDFARTSNPNHVTAGFPRECSTCHTTATWQGATFNHTTLTKFALTGAHANVACASCHVGGQFSGTPQACIGCHLADFERTKDPDHRRANFATQCETCHTTVNWANAKFDHNQSRFTLTGKHASATCEQCHVGGKFTGTSTVCYDCHQQSFQSTKAPAHVAAGFPTNCTLCHTTSQWQGAVFDHGTTKFPLTGKHSGATCQQCHASGQYATLPTACATCHLTDFQNTKNPNHVAASFPQDCQLCHTTTQWTGAVFDHTKTRFPLTGKHSASTCQQCHASGQYATLPTACATCHLTAYQNTKNPNHVAASFPQDCQLCHTTTQWTGAVFDHTKTRFPLTGKHSASTCQQCHASGQYATLPTACATCHLTAYQNTKNPNHVAASFPQDCQLCHSTTQWTGAVFDHTKTRFPLTGKHSTSTCQQCHASGQYATLPTTCVTCHLPDYQGSKNPDHAAAGFPQDCQLCHTTSVWTGAKFDHTTATKFPLTGKHIAASCIQCHAGNRFADAPADCAGCHLPDFQKTTNPNHASAGFSTTCSLCHSTTQWQGAQFDHGKTKFPLTGRHTSATCQQCHSNGQFANLPAACVNCHQSEYQSTKSPNHAAAGFPSDCALCHTTNRWTGATFDHNKTRFALSGKHSSATCQQCHASGQYATLPTACATCHLTEYRGTKNPNHTAASFPQDCQLCHTTIQWTGATFDHSKTRFPLAGKHSTATCQQCHASGQYATLPTTCITCHQTEFQNTKNPNHPAAGFSNDCSQCHTTTQWTGATFDHTKTRFPLTGKHTATTCQQCHSSGQYATLPTTCVTCHLTNYQNTKNPNHVAAQFPQDCQLCHSTTQWTGAVFDHTKTRFPLTGKHTAATCQQCHASGQYATLPTTCVTCHLTNFQNTKNPNHVAAGFSNDCSQCHTTAQWTGAVFDHTKTRFPLTGKHSAATCQQCHASGQYATLPTTCVTCHQTEYQNTKTPNHAAAGFPTDCALCHSTTRWPGATFDHTKTRFPLTGKHSATTCAQCHASGQYATLPTTCVSCHLTNFQNSKNPNHVAANFSQDCALCHTTSQWPGAKFDHTTATRFPLTGKHTSVTCASCHVNNQYATLPTTCVTCHLAKYQATTSPNHLAAGFPQDCSLCHTTAQWPGATFNHTATRFPLSGKHASLTCAQCHSSGQYATLPTTCVSCHLAKYQATTSPNHVAAGFPQDCSLCHTTTQWPGATFNHTATKFPLTGKHTTVGCATCHVNNQYATLPTTCVTCHLQKYQATTNPNHVAAGFPQDCSLCHTTTQWPGATFNHSTTAFPLSGKHTTVQCAQCHVNGVYKGTPKDCYTCHVAVYNSTTNPNHKAAGFPTTCATCHTTTQWTGATFNHTWFPITNGNHKVACATCHTNPTNYTVFTCTSSGCHTQTTTDNHHKGVRNYVYNSINCYSCHPNGKN